MLFSKSRLFSILTIVATLTASATAGGKDIVDTAVSAGSFQTLVAAVQAAGLVDTLKGEGPFTVFAPTDEAFAKLPEGTLETLLKPENKDQLVSILTFHVVSGKVLSKDVVNLTAAKTVQGANVAVTIDGHQVKVNDAQVVKADIECTNGVIHVIDSVLLPPAKSAAMNPRTMIEQAIASGAPLYNAGHIDQCCEIYQSAMQQLVSDHGQRMSANTRTHLMSTLSQASSVSCSDSKAWMLRRGLDQAYASIVSNP